jgi:hypothetical protein
MGNKQKSISKKYNEFWEKEIIQDIEKEFQYPKKEKLIIENSTEDLYSTKTLGKNNKIIYKNIIIIK